MPPLVLTRHRIFDWLDDVLGVRYVELPVTWKLTAYDEVV